MKAEYRGYEINVTREKCLAGYFLMYFQIYRISDGFECLCNFEDSDESIPDKITQLKERIDNEHLEEDPWMENERF